MSFYPSKCLRCHGILLLITSGCVYLDYPIPDHAFILVQFIKQRQIEQSKYSSVKVYSEAVLMEKEKTLLSFF